MSVSIRPAGAGDKSRWLILWQGYLDFYKTAVPPAQTERTWERILDSEFNMKCSRLYWNTDEENTTARKLYDSYVLESGKPQYRIQLVNIPE